MALPINPTLREVIDANAIRATNTNVGVASGFSQSSQVFKSNLDRNISLLAGGPGSGLGPNPSVGEYPSGTYSNSVSALAGVPTNINSLNPTMNTPGISTTVPGTSGQGEIIATGSSSSSRSGSNSVSSVLGALGTAAAIFAAGSSILTLLATKVRQDTPGRTPVQPGSPEDWRVRISFPNGIFDETEMLEATGGVVFPYLPNITLSTKANYTTIDTIHSNYPFYAYKNSSVDDITISGDFTAETESDALYWVQATSFFRAATKMFFGQGSNAGNPPLICTMYGYGASMFQGLPIIIKSFQVDFKDDVNYIRCSPPWGVGPTWVPILSTVQVSVSPIYSREKLRRFDLRSYQAGYDDSRGYI